MSITAAGETFADMQVDAVNEKVSIANNLDASDGAAADVADSGNDDGKTAEKVETGVFADHHNGLNRIVELLIDKEHGVIQDKSEITAVGHRVVHGGEAFQSPTIIDEKVIDAIKENIPLAPLHNPPNLTGIEVSRTIFPDAPQVAVFDTAFHQTMPDYSFIYGIPYELYTTDGIRRYGFHGTSHRYVSQKAAEVLRKPLKKLKIITVHLGNGCSVTAIKHGRSVDTSMGFTPLEGLVMGTRCGDIDPASVIFLAQKEKIELTEIDRVLNHDSGLKGISGIGSDMREIEKAASGGHARARLALEVFTYKAKKCIGSYAAAMGGVDGIVFTGGISWTVGILYSARSLLMTRPFSSNLTSSKRASPSPINAEPSICPSTEARLMARPQSWAAVIFSTVMCPVSISTLTSAICALQP